MQAQRTADGHLVPAVTTWSRQRDTIRMKDGQIISYTACAMGSVKSLLVLAERFEVTRLRDSRDMDQMMDDDQISADHGS